MLNGIVILIKIYQQAVYCAEFPVQKYLLTLTSEQTGVIPNILLDFINTEITVRPEDGVVDNQKYTFTVTAINRIGNTTSHRKSFCE